MTTEALKSPGITGERSHARTRERETVSKLRPSRSAEKVTVNLSVRSADALDELNELTGDTKTEAINKALQAYVMLQRAQSNGGEIQMREGASDPLTRIRFF